MLRLTLFGSFLALLIAAPAFGGNVAVTLGLKSGALTLQAPQASATAGKAIQVPITVADGARQRRRLDAATQLSEERRDHLDHGPLRSRLHVHPPPLDRLNERQRDPSRRTRTPGWA